MLSINSAKQSQFAGFEIATATLSDRNDIELLLCEAP